MKDHFRLFFMCCFLVWLGLFSWSSGVCFLVVVGVLLSFLLVFGRVLEYYSLSLFFIQLGLWKNNLETKDPEH